MKIISTNAIVALFDNQVITDKGLILKYNKKEKIVISFSELEKIYIKVYQSKFKYISILIPALLAFLYIEYAQLDITMFMALFPVIPFFVKTNYFRRYALIIQLKDGSHFRKKFPMKMKYENIEFINIVKREVQKNANSKKNYQHKTMESEADFIRTNYVLSS